MKTLSKATYPRQPHSGWDDQGAPLPVMRCAAWVATGLPLYHRCPVTPAEMVCASKSDRKESQ